MSYKSRQILPSRRPSEQKKAFYQNVGFSHVLLFVREHISQCQICSPLMILYFLFDVRNVGSRKGLKSV